MLLRSSAILIILFLCFREVILGYVSAYDSVALRFSSQNANANGSSNSLISVAPVLNYINKGDNASTIGNYFSGYYYDSNFGYFKTDWSATNDKENVHITGSTNKCTTGYGYRLGGYAYSEYFGYIDFDYRITDDIYVYYCVTTNRLYGYAYSVDLGYQNFGGIQFIDDLDNNVIGSKAQIEQTADTNLTQGGDFSNGTSTNITSPGNVSQIGVIGDAGTFTPPPIAGEYEDSNFTSETIQSDILEFDVRDESLFYIIK